jgi:hypothetical protein
MSGARAQFVLALLAGSVSLTVTNPAIAAERHSRHHPVKQEQAVPTVPEGPPTPLIPFTLEQTPANPPVVTYGNGELAIVAQNSTLGDILRAVRAQTHAALDVPANATERVVGRFGPGPAREVVAELLNGSHFNYVLLGSAADPSALDRVVLTAKSAAAPETAAQVPINPPQPNGFPARSVPGFSASNSSDMTDDQPDDNDSDVQSDDQAAAQDQQSNRPAIKTPEQLLQELQRQQQLQQQQGAAQNPPAETTPRQR